MAAPQKKVCFITIGATAGFNELITAALDDEFLKVLSHHGFTNLLIQYGKEGKAIFEARQKTVQPQEHGVKLEGFAFNSEGLGAEMRAAKAEKGSLEGVVISHAGQIFSPSPVNQKCAQSNVMNRLWEHS
jgi:beta-1,4-N-acetylglucosaminyltransferase